jgi:hypothetical protein
MGDRESRERTIARMRVIRIANYRPMGTRDRPAERQLGGGGGGPLGTTVHPRSNTIFFAKTDVPARDSRKAKCAADKENIQAIEADVRKVIITHEAISSRRSSVWRPDF